MFYWLYRAFTQNIGTKLISVIVAVVLWVVVFNSWEVEVTQKVPLKIVAPAGYMVETETPEEVSVRLVGPQSFLRSIIDQPQEPIRIEVKERKIGRINYRLFSDQVPVPSRVEVLDINPKVVPIYLDQVSRKKVKLKAQFNGSLPKEYDLERVEITPPEIKIQGSSQVLKGLNVIETRPINLNNIKNPQTIPAKLDLKASGVKVLGPQPKVQLLVRSKKEANYRLRNVKVRHSFDKRSVEIIPSKVTVLVRIKKEDLKNINESNVIAQIPHRSYKTGQTFKSEVSIKLPENVGFVSIEPEKVQVRIGGRQQ